MEWILKCSIDKSENDIYIIKIIDTSHNRERETQATQITQENYERIFKKYAQDTWELINSEINNNNAEE